MTLFLDLLLLHIYVHVVYYGSVIKFYIYIYIYIQGGARNVIPLIVHITHFYYYKSI